MEENLRTVDRTLTPEDVREIERVTSAIPIVGDRYNAEEQRQVQG